MMTFLRKNGYSREEIDEMSSAEFFATFISLGELEGNKFDEYTFTWKENKS